MWLHGFWGIPDEFLRLVDELDPDRRLHAYLPQAPRHVNQGRYAWFDGEWPERPEERAAPVAEWLDGLPFPRERVILGGWSQGAEIAYTLALAPRVERPAALVAAGGALPSDVPLDLERPLPAIAIAHGTLDEAMRVDWARLARDRLAAAGADVLYLETAVGHEPDPAWFPTLREFVASVL